MFIFKCVYPFLKQEEVVPSQQVVRFVETFGTKLIQLQILIFVHQHFMLLSISVFRMFLDRRHYGTTSQQSGRSHLECFSCIEGRRISQGFDRTFFWGVTFSVIFYGLTHYKQPSPRCHQSIAPPPRCTAPLMRRSLPDGISLKMVFNSLEDLCS